MTWDFLNHQRTVVLAVSLFTVFGTASVLRVSDAAERTGLRRVTSFDKDIQPFLARYCVDCHGAEVQKAGFALHNVTEDDLGDWEKIAENIELELMPPPKSKQPSKEMRFAVADWIRSHLKKNEREFRPEPTSAYGNRLRHEDLFSGEHKGPAFSYPRLWRISQRIYDNISRNNGATRGVAGTSNGPVPALVGVEGEAFKDYDILRADDSAVRAMMLNFRKLSSRIVRGEYRRGKFNKEKNDFDPGTYDTGRSALKNLSLLKQASPDPETYEEAVTKSFELLLSRQPNPQELARFRKFLAKSIELSDPATGCQNMVMAILMSPEFMFRMELGRGEEVGNGRRMLGPRELAYAIAYGLTDSPPDRELSAAVEAARLKSREDVEREVRRMLWVEDDRTSWSYNLTGGSSPLDWQPKHNPRLLRFFREYFGYTKGYLVFKDEARRRHHYPHNLIRDADIMILDIIEKDKNVLESLLTTDQFIVAYTNDFEGGAARMREWARERPALFGGGAMREGIQPAFANKHYRREAVEAYGLRYFEWNYPRKQPFKVENRVGFLTHPAWLVAWSGNFNNDIIRRGKWIREHLLADALPELPIGVDAQLPNDPHRTLRDRMQVTRAEECWRCHKQMDDLGMAFEAYNDFGLYRNGTIVLGDETRHAAAMLKYSQGRENTLKQIWELTADSPDVRAKYIETIQAWIQNQTPPEKNHPRYQDILEEQERHRAQWNEQIAELKRPRDEQTRLRKLAELREHLASMEPPKPEHSAPVDTAGILIGTRDPKLDGPYKDAADLMNRLAKSKRVRQSFIRHIFRYFMGRNEMLTDSPTLIAMDQAYVESGGSYKEVLVTLMTSDSFLTRRDKE